MLQLQRHHEEHIYVLLKIICGRAFKKGNNRATQERMSVRQYINKSDTKKDLKW
jgi:hypothetical protein